MYILYCLKPATQGNVLIVPKRHVEIFNQLESPELEEFHLLCKELSEAFHFVYDKDNYLIVQKNGKGAGQTVDHVHFHIVPFHESSDPSKVMHRVFNYRKALNEKEMQENCLKLRAYFSREEEKEANPF